MLLFLDDERVPSQVTWVKLPKIADENWVILRNYGQFIEWISVHFQQGGDLPNFISFDHDLGLPANHNNTNEKTGLDCAKYLVNFCMDYRLDFPEYACHSMNCIGRDNIVGYIESYKKSLKL